MWVHLYVAEKTRELDHQRLAQIHYAELKKLRAHGLPVFGRMAGATGRSMRRVGEALEMWATRASEREHVRVGLARSRRSD